VAPEPFGDGVRDLGECSGRGLKKSVARTYGYSGRTWTPLILPVLGGGGVERKAGWPGGSLTMGRNGPGQGEKARWQGFLHNGKERAGTRGKRVMAGVPSQWEGTGLDKGKSGMSGVPSQWEGTGRDKGRKAGCSEVGSGVGVGGCIGSRTGTGIGIMSSAGSARYFC
jgi:hypothetical protein